MINRIIIEGFKRFVRAEFDIRPLTILVGLNGSGKTSVIHSLLLAHEAWYRKAKRVELNGPHGINLGSFGDVINHSVAERFQITIFDENSTPYCWRFSGIEADLFANVVVPQGGGNVFFGNKSRAFQFISAERQGPRVSQKASALHSDDLKVGNDGRYSAQILDMLGSSKILSSRRVDEAENVPQLLKPQAERWLSLISRNVQIDTESYPGAATVALKFRTDVEWIKPTNMGFGVTSSLAIILACLTAPSRGIVIVDSPEAHLHPAGQSNIGIFLAKMATTGLNIIVETHSDHVLNGIRRAIGEKRYLSHDDAVAYNFDISPDSHPEKLSFTETGGVSNWPAGFFDQYRIDVAALTRVRRTR